MAYIDQYIPSCCRPFVQMFFVLFFWLCMYFVQFMCSHHLSPAVVEEELIFFAMTSPASRNSSIFSASVSGTSIRRHWSQKGSPSRPFAK